MRIKYNSFVTKNEIEGILIQKYPDHRCPSCGSNGIYAGCVETQFDEKRDSNVVLSFDVFCRECGGFFGKWDNTNVEYLFGKR